MNKYTVEQVEAEADCLPDAYEDQAAKLRDYAALLRERESAKAGVTSQMRATACDAYDKEMVGHGETANPVAMRAALEAVAPMLASARVPDERKAAMYADESRRDHYEAAIYDKGWNDCRKTMLAAAPKPETEE